MAGLVGVRVNIGIGLRVLRRERFPFPTCARRCFLVCRFLSTVVWLFVCQIFILIAAS